MAALRLSELKPAERSKKNHKRIGRGPGSGKGKTSGRGHTGQKSRSGAKIKPWMEGGQMPISRRIPKRGFTNIFKKVFQVVNLKALEKCQPGEVTPETLKELGIIKSTRVPVKILGVGNVVSALHVKAAAFSRSASEKIIAAGGKVEVL